MGPGFGLEGRSALVVGGGQGMGRSAALALARAGCELALVDLVGERARAVADEVRALGRRAEALEADVTDPAAAEAAVARAGAAHGRVDVLVNVVGMASWAPLLELDPETWDRDHALNLRQHFLVCRAAARHMVARGGGGAVAMVASVSGLFAAPNHAAYGAAKAGLVALAKSMAEEWYDHGIRVNCVAPGAVKSARILAQQAAGEAPGGDEARMCESDDIAHALLFLCSDLARAITGQTLVVDLGKTTLFPYDLD